MKRIPVIMALIWIAFSGIAQVKISGIVIEKATDEPLAGASVIFRNSEGKIRKYATSNAKGEYMISVADTAGCSIDVSMIGFAKQTVRLNGQEPPIKVLLEPATLKLKEVTVKADRIREQGDTITYNVGGFAQAHDRSIGDVLRRMPGIDVSNTGKIQYQGEDINKFYIEGSDLLGGKYGIATNGIKHEDVGAVEVMENHQPMQVLSGISFSDKAAINLKLKNKAKATWTFHGDAAGGYSWLPEGAAWDGELFAMAVMPSFQNITTFKTNNIGYDLSAQATDFFASHRGTELSRYISVSLPNVPSLSQKRTLFNRSALMSTNSLWKMNSGELKAQIDYAFNRITAHAVNITTYFLNDGDRIVVENRDGRNRSHSLSGKFIYEVNNKTTFINNTLQTNIDWDNMRLGVTGSLTNEQSASLPDYYVTNQFKMIKRFNGKHLVTFQSNNEWESIPQTLNVSMDGGNFSQHIGDHAFYTHESAAYAFSLKGITVSLEGGVKGYMRSLDANLPDMPEEIPGLTHNILNTNYFTVYATPKFEYWIKRVNFTINAPFSFAHYSFDKTLANRSEVYFSPSLSLNWKPNNRISIGLRGGTGRSPMTLNLIHPGYIMTDYRSFQQGVDDFYNTSSQNASANISYKHTRKGIFANAMIMHSWSHIPYTMAQQLYGDYIVYSYSPAKSSGKAMIAMGNIGKTLDFIRGSANLNGSFNRSESRMMSENEFVSSIRTSWRAGLKINGAPVSWLSIDYDFTYSLSRLAMNSVKNSWLNNMENSLLLNVMPHEKWEWQIIGEHYRNELTSGKYKNTFLLDTKVSFKLSKRLELSARLNNILNQQTYNYTTYSQLSSFESQRWLRGRELLITISLRK